MNGMGIPDVQRAKKTIVVSAAGAANEDIGPFRGFLEEVIYTKVDYANGVDFVITSKRTGESLWAENNVNSSVTKRPAALTHDGDGVATTQYDRIFVEGDVNVVIAAGGVSKSGTFEIVCIAE
jgi:predicted polyphosphate/ATP-dependent NAD kinase